MRWLVLAAVCGCSFTAAHADGAVEADTARPDAFDLTGDLVAYYPMDALPPHDATGHGHDPTCATTCPALAPGERGSAYAFDDQRLDVPLDAALETGSGTAASWLVFDALPDSGTYACPLGTVYMAPTNGNTWQLCFMTGTWSVFFETGSGGESMSGSADVGSGDWHHVAIAWTASRLELYIDGALLVGSDITPLVFDPAGLLTLGADRIDNGTNGSGAGGIDVPLTGRLDDTALFDRALTASELVAVAAGSGL